MDVPTGRAWIELDMGALGHNVAALQALLPHGCRLMPAVKANAYGHGGVLVAKELNRLGVDAFCVATVLEGVELRQKGVHGLILILGYTHPEQFSLLGRYDLTQTVVDCEYAKALDGYGHPIQVHIGIDTGMHRLGARWEHTDQICELFHKKNLRVEGIFTHLCADDTDDEGDKRFTIQQADAFWGLVHELNAQDCPCPKTHILGSYGLLNYPELGGDFARIGIALYGVLSTREDGARCKINLRPVLSVRARISSVRPLYQGEGAGYGLCYTARENRMIAALAIGYADGLPRSLSCGVGRVLIHGCSAPIIGRICMDQTLVDVTDIVGVQAGDIATIVGADGKETVSAYDIAEQSHTITNEILSRLGSRLERIVR